jgi:hypothetical protein
MRELGRTATTTRPRLRRFSSRRGRGTQLAENRRQTRWTTWDATNSQRGRSRLVARAVAVLVGRHRLMPSRQNSRRPSSRQLPSAVGSWTSAGGRLPTVARPCRRARGHPPPGDRHRPARIACPQHPPDAAPPPGGGDPGSRLWHGCVRHRTTHPRLTQTIADRRPATMTDLLARPDGAEIGLR